MARSAGDQTIEVLPFNNQTLEPRLGDAVTQALRERLQLDGTYRLATHSAGDIVVTGVIKNYSREGLSYLNTDVSRRKITALASSRTSRCATSATGKLLLDKDMNGFTLVHVGSNLASAERQSLPLLAEDLARNVGGIDHRGRVVRQNLFEFPETIFGSTVCETYVEHRTCININQYENQPRKNLPPHPDRRRPRRGSGGRARAGRRHQRGGHQAAPAKAKKAKSSLAFHGAASAVDTNAMTITVGEHTFNVTSDDQDHQERPAGGFERHHRGRNRRRCLQERRGRQVGSHQHQSRRQEKEGRRATGPIKFFQVQESSGGRQRPPFLLPLPPTRQALGFRVTLGVWYCRTSNWLRAAVSSMMNSS